MKLIRVESRPSFKVQCKNCGAVVWSSDGLFADVDGKPFEDYYCENCAIFEAPLKAMQKTQKGNRK